MKSITKTLAIVTAVLGLGTINNVSANENKMQESLKRMVVAQGQRITLELADQLQQSIKLNVNKVVSAGTAALAEKNETKLVKNSQQSNKNTSTAEDE